MSCASASAWMLTQSEAVSSRLFVDSRIKGKHLKIYFASGSHLVREHLHLWLCFGHPVLAWLGLGG